MNSLWAPWRMEYVKRDKTIPSDCIFCKKYASDKDKENFVLCRMEHSYVLMNLYPYNNGHLMIVPVAHKSEYGALNSLEQKEISELTRLSIQILKKTLNPQGFNIGMNIGEVGGAGIADHLHQHIVPRWVGDTNFMPITGHTKVMVEGLNETWSSLRQEFDKIKK